MNAANLIDLAYKRKRKPNESNSEYNKRKLDPFILVDGTKVKVKDIYLENEAEAFALMDGTLVIPGSDSVQDYIRYNFNYGILALREKLKNLFKPKGIIYHKGFLAHSREIEGFAVQNNIIRITGHSLGAASSQLLASRLGLKAINFAAPKVVRRGWFVEVEKGLIENFNRKDDSVTRFPGWRWKHIGDTSILDTKVGHFGFDHQIKHYVTAMNIDHVQDDVKTRFT